MTWPASAARAAGGSATDADEDAAFALLMASKKWGGGVHGRRGRDDGRRDERGDVDGAPYVWGGNNYKSQHTTNNPSYFAPAYYRAFATASGNTAWTTSRTASYTQINAANASQLEWPRSRPGATAELHRDGDERRPRRT